MNKKAVSKRTPHKQKAVNIFKAFMAGFMVVAFVLLALQLLAPVLGFSYEVGWKSTFDLEKSSTPVIHASWFAPIIVGVVFAIVQFFDDFEEGLKKKSRKLIKSREVREVLTVFWHGLWGLALGFVVSMFLLALLAGSNKTYIIPYLLEATAEGSSVRATTSLMTIFTILGLVWGLWKAQHLPKK